MNKNQKRKTAQDRYKGYCPIRAGDLSKPIDRISYNEMDAKTFYDKYVSKRVPVVIQGFPETLSPSHFTLTHLNSLIGNENVNVEVRKTKQESFGKGIKEPMPMSTFLQLLQRGSNSYYLTTQPIEEDNLGPIHITSPFMSKCLQHLPIDHPLLPTLVPHQVNMWIGSSKEYSTSGLHHDFHDNIYALMSGRKKFRLYAPCQATVLPLKGQAAKILPNGLIVYKEQQGIREDGANDIEVLKWRARGKRHLGEIRSNKESGQDEEESDAENALDELMLAVSKGNANESDLDLEAEFVVGEGAACGANVIPPSFCTENTVSREKGGSASILNQYWEVDLESTEMLYIPASWFHEVLSVSEPNSNYHLAVNWWYYPPVFGNTYENPYDDCFWADAQRNLLLQCKIDVSAVEKEKKSAEDGIIDMIVREQVSSFEESQEEMAKSQNKCNSKLASCTMDSAATVKSACSANNAGTPCGSQNQSCASNSHCSINSAVAEKALKTAIIEGKASQSTCHMSAKCCDEQDECCDMEGGCCDMEGGCCDMEGDCCDMEGGCCDGNGCCGTGCDDIPPRRYAYSFKRFLKTMDIVRSMKKKQKMEVALEMLKFQ